MMDDGEIEARVVVLGEDVEGADPLAIGSLLSCAEVVSRMTPEQRTQVCVWTDARIFSADEAIALLDGGADGDPL